MAFLILLSGPKDIALHAADSSFSPITPENRSELSRVVLKCKGYFWQRINSDFSVTEMGAHNRLSHAG